MLIRYDRKAPADLGIYLFHHDRPSGLVGGIAAHNHLSGILDPFQQFTRLPCHILFIPGLFISLTDDAIPCETVGNLPDGLVRRPKDHDLVYQIFDAALILGIHDRIIPGHCPSKLLAIFLHAHRLPLHVQMGILTLISRLDDLRDRLFPCADHFYLATRVIQRPACYTGFCADCRRYRRRAALIYAKCLPAQIPGIVISH